MMTTNSELSKTGMQSHLCSTSFYKGSWTLPLGKVKYGNKHFWPFSILHLLLFMGGVVMCLIPDTHLATSVRWWAYSIKKVTQASRFSLWGHFAWSSIQVANPGQTTHCSLEGTDLGLKWRILWQEPLIWTQVMDTFPIHIC